MSSNDIFRSHEVNEGNFIPTLEVQGQVYDRIGSLMAQYDRKPSFLQVYFVGDEDRERNIRFGIYPGINSQLTLISSTAINAAWSQ